MRKIDNRCLFVFSLVHILSGQGGRDVPAYRGSTLLKEYLRNILMYLEGQGFRDYLVEIQMLRGARQNISK